MIASGRLVLCLVTLVIISGLVTINIRSPQRLTALTSFLHDKDGAAKQPFAYATFLSGIDPGNPQYWNETVLSDEPNEEDLQAKDDLDGYYQGVRNIVYSLLHHPPTRSHSHIPVVVLVTTGVSERKRARLAADGAQIVVTEAIKLPSWVTPGSSRWRDVMTKLALFSMTDYIKLCFIDADHLITGNLDGVFEDPATDLAQTRLDPGQVQNDEAPQPPTYVFAGKADAFSYDHEIPPQAGEYLNAGFYVFHPSNELFQYYKSVLELPGRFDTQYPEQNLFNYAHRKSGNMPWQALNWQWNMNWPTIRDFDAGAKSFHAKYWDEDPTHDETLKRIWLTRLAEMRAYYRGVEDAATQHASSLSSLW